MLTRLLNKVRKPKAATSTTPVDSRATTKTFKYNVLVPGQVPVVLRGANQNEVRKMVRDAHGLTRLPAGTSITRLS